MPAVGSILLRGLLTLIIGRSTTLAPSSTGAARAPEGASRGPSTKTQSRARSRASARSSGTEAAEAPVADAPKAAATEARPSGTDAPERRAPEALMALAETRLAIEGVDPEIDAGRFAAKCVAGRPLQVEADAFSDGHEVIRVALRWRARGGGPWSEVEMAQIVNDRWGAEITTPSPGPYEYGFVAWRDLYGTWHRDTAKKIAAGQDVGVEAEEGRILVRRAIEAAPGDARALEALLSQAQRGVEPLMAAEAVTLMRRAEPRANLSHYPRVLPLWADREAAAFSAWYEMLPRSWGEDGRTARSAT